MCWLCDHPECTPGDWLDALWKLKQRQGWVVPYVEDERRPFAYTAGLHEHGLPELMVTGLDPPEAVRTLNAVARYLLDGGRPLPGERISIDGAPPLEVVQVQHPDVHLRVAVAFYGPISALQLVWPDARGHLPWCAQFSGRAQPVLGVRAASLL